MSVEEVKNCLEKGGLNLVCVYRMSNSLLLSQFLRLLRSSDAKSVAHVAYWIGDSIGDLLSGVDDGLHPRIIPDYFAVIESLVVHGRIDDLVAPQTWKGLTNKVIYSKSAESLPVPKVEVQAGVSFKRVWQLITLPVLPSSSYDIPYLLIHNKLPLYERLFRVGVRNDLYCEACPDALICDAEHYFCKCVKVEAAWLRVKSSLHTLIGVGVPCERLISFLFPKSHFDKEVVWLIGSYLTEVWNQLYHQKKSHIKSEELFGFLKYKYRTDQQGARIQLRSIPGLS